MPPTKTSWIRHRFHCSSVNDPRPVIWPPKGPYWVSGEGDDYAILIAYLPAGVEVTTFWPEATDVDSEECDGITYTSRFAKPSWWKGE